MYDLIVVGGGPAGLTATIYAIRKHLNVLMVTKDLGGKTNYHLALPWIEDYQVIRGLEIVNKFRTELEYLNFARHMEPVEKLTKTDKGYFQIITKGGGVLDTRSVIIATGVRQERLTIPGEKQFIMRGLCYSALSYAQLFIDRTTVVIGDGDLALRSTAELATVAKHVTLVGPIGAVLNSPLGKKLVKTLPNVTILSGYQVVEILGKEYAELIKVKGPAGQIVDLPAEGSFVELGLNPVSQMVEGLVDLDKEGRIMVNHHMSTSVPGIFAAGDVTDSYAEQVLVAVGDGAKAALSAYDYLLPIL